MTPIAILATVLAYFAVLFLVSSIARRNVDNAAFFTGSRQSKWYMVAFAMIGASISGVTYVSVPGMVSQSGFGIYRWSAYRGLRSHTIILSFAAHFGLRIPA